MDDTIDIAELNDLREKVLRGEEVPPEKYHEVLVHVQKLRRDVKSKAKGEVPSGPLNMGSILFGKAPT